LIDDIRWDDPRFSSENPKAYDGWLAVVGHDRVERAVSSTMKSGSFFCLECQGAVDNPFFSLYEGLISYSGLDIGVSI
jgi:hypothetical protein